MSRTVIRLFQALQLLCVPELMRIRSGMWNYGGCGRAEFYEQQLSNSYFGMSSGDDTTSSSTYPFYDTGFIRGTYVGSACIYIEMDEGQEDQKTGIWLGDYYIVDADTENPYVWAVDSKGRLEKRSVVLGQHDDDLSEYEIADGLKEDDSIAFPSDSLAEGT